MVGGDATTPVHEGDTEDGAVALRVMTAGDLGEVLAIERASFSSPWSEVHFREEMASPFCHDMVAVLREEIAGYMSFAIVYDEVHVRNIAVRGDLRRLGIATRMMKEMLDVAMRRQVRWAFLEVRVSNRAACGLYGKFGFTVKGMRRAYYTGPPEDALVLGADLCEKTAR